MGGGERSLILTMSAVAGASPGIDRVLIAGGDGPLLQCARDIGADVRLLPLPREIRDFGDSGLRGGAWAAAVGMAVRSPPLALGLVDYTRRLRKLLRAIGPDLVHSNGMKSHALSAITAPPGVPVVWHIRDFLGERPLMKWILRSVPRPSVAIANSQSVADDVRRVLPELRVKVVLNAVDTDRFSPGPGDGPGLDRLAGLPTAEPGAVRVGLVATYASWKGQDVFLHALAQLAADAPKVRGYIVGGPIYTTAGSQFSREQLRRLTRRLGLDARVGFVPYQADPADVYRALDVAVHASTRPEPFGLTIAEAMACARPVVVAAAGGAAELFTHGRDGLGHAPGDANNLARCVAMLAGDAAMRARLGESARATALGRFSPHRYAGEMARVYRDCLHERADAGRT